MTDYVMMYDVGLSMDQTLTGKLLTRTIVPQYHCMTRMRYFKGFRRT